MRVRDKVFKIPEVKLKKRDVDYSSGIRQSMRSKSEIKHRMKVDSIDPSEGPSSTSSRRNKSTFILLEEERSPVKDIMKLRIASLPSSDRSPERKRTVKHADEKELAANL